MKTSDQKFTPGPWVIFPKSINNAVFQAVGRDNGDDSISGITDAVFRRADASLLAAAPDLYAALDRLDKIAGNYNPEFPMAARYHAEFCAAMDAARAALAKARSEP